MSQNTGDETRRLKGWIDLFFLDGGKNLGKFSRLYVLDGFDFHLRLAPQAALKRFIINLKVGK